MFKLFFATPDKKVVSGAELEEITLPAFKGELNILPGHLPLMTSLDAGILKYRLKDGESKKLAISWGYCQTSADGVTVLAETAVESQEIDQKVVRAHLAGFETKMSQESLTDTEWEKVQHEIARLKAEIDLIEQK